MKVHLSWQYINTLRTLLNGFNNKFVSLSLYERISLQLQFTSDIKMQNFHVLGFDPISLHKMGTSDMLYSICSYCKVHPLMTMMVCLIICPVLYLGPRPTLEFFDDTIKESFKILKALLSGNIKNERNSVLFFVFLVCSVIIIYVVIPYWWILVILYNVCIVRNVTIPLLIVFTFIFMFLFYFNKVYREEEMNV